VTDRVGAPMSLLGLGAILWATAIASLLVWKFGDLHQR
jgi:hypothetical protein